MDEQTPWKDGFWKVKSDDMHVERVKGKEAMGQYIADVIINQIKVDLPISDEIKGTWTYGQFKKAPEVLKNLTGKSHYNVKKSYLFLRSDKWYGKNWYGILDDNGTTMHLMDIFHDKKKVLEQNWLDEDDIKKIIDSYEDINDRSHFYKVQPENQGKLIFLSGAPGCGKSTTALKLAQKAGFVYYEGDGFTFKLNPYIPLDVKEPGHALEKQKAVKGLSSDDLKTFKALGKFFEKDLLKGDTSNQESTFPFYTLFAKDVASEKQKIGGDWAVAQAIPTRKIRDVIKKECNATFIVLTMSKKYQKQRLSGRHSKDFHPKLVNFLAALHKSYESVQPDEKDAYEVFITPEMSADDVVDKVLDLINHIEETPYGVVDLVKDDTKESTGDANKSTKRRISNTCSLI